MSVTTSTCAFALHCLGVPAIQPSSKEAFKGPGVCAVCGEDAQAFGQAFQRTRILTPSFGPSESLADFVSPAVCSACVHFSLGVTFQAAIKDRDPPLKVWPQVSWRSYSHVFSETLGHFVPRREDWRTLFVSPPQGRFLAVMTTAGMKNLIYRSPIAHDGDVLFPMQVEEAQVWVERPVLLQVLEDFEAALADGLRRDELLSGDYSAGCIFKVGRAIWQRHEECIRDHRTRRLQLLRLAHAVASNPAR